MEEIQRLLLQFQRRYDTGEPAIYGSFGDFLLIYTTSRALELYFSLLYAEELRSYLHTVNMNISYLTFTDSLVIIECTAATNTATSSTSGSTTHCPRSAGYRETLPATISV
jgi:hypothetical protein